MKLPDKRYNIIYADPPWETRYFKAYNRGQYSVKLPYPTMTDKDIIDLPVNSISATDSALFIWCIDQKIKVLPELFDAWGFDLKCIAFIWYKKAKTTNGSNSPFPNFTRRSCEYCFLGTKGKLKPVSRKVEQFHSVIKGKHSEKPSLFRDEITQLYGDITRIELFAREITSGWDVWGNQISNHRQTVLTK